MASHWLNSPEHSGIIPISTSQSLYLSVSGPPRTFASQPVVIIEAGLGSTSSEWLAVQRLISKFARVFIYDRAGYGRSCSNSAAPTLNPPAITASQRNNELTMLLESIGVRPPWVLIGHSYGGLLMRSFLFMHGEKEVKGMVIVDSPVYHSELPKGWSTLLGIASHKEANQRLCVDDWPNLLLTQLRSLGWRQTAARRSQTRSGSRSRLRRVIMLAKWRRVLRLLVVLPAKRRLQRSLTGSNC